MPFMEILISQGPGSQPENHTAIRTHDRFCIFTLTAQIFEVSSASHRLHQGIKHHHRL